jgi:cell wall-active antibiotic response 4TMS protein YvqF
VLTTMLGERPESSEYGMIPAPPLPPTLTVLFGSLKRNGRFSVPPTLQIKAAFGELKLDLREALFPEKHVRMVAESLCASVEVLLPEGVTVVDEGMSLMSSHKVSQTAEEHGPVIHLDGWSVCSDVKFLSGDASPTS